MYLQKRHFTHSLALCPRFKRAKHEATTQETEEIIHLKGERRMGR
uniref:Uncharacterized protein n=1 Tax=Anguilla anguilla TaxID=7936 RepID=A0A0E9VM08_ANGAN